MEDYDSFGSSSNFSLNKILLCLFSFLNLPLIVEIPSVLGLGESVIPTALTIFILVADFILLLIFIINLIKILKIKLRQKRKVNKNINISKDKESLYCDAKTFVSNSSNELNQYEINRPTELNYNDYIRKILNYYQYNVRTFSTSLTHSMYNSKEKAPIYSIQYFEFFQSTRILKISFLETKEYRTIERYVQQNYQKYPIYSDWKVKTKTIEKTLKLTNKQLEELENIDDELIKAFSLIIIIKLNKLSLTPSWAAHDLISKYIAESSKEIEQKILTLNENYNYYSNIFNDYSKKLEKIKEKYINRFIKLNEKINKFIFKYQKKDLTNSKILNKFNEKSNQLNKKKKFIKDILEAITGKIDESNDFVLLLNKFYSSCSKNYNNKLLANKIDWEKYSSQIKSLPEYVNINNGKFTPLKELSSFEYRKIRGCYIIRNRELDKYYVGQSKDIIKRLKTHFIQTKPHNIIFYDDWINSNFENKEDLFEFKIIENNTIDLDALEKNLIEKYDSKNRGYNLTKGNG